LQSQDKKINTGTNLELLFLGTGNAFAMAHRYWGSILVDDRILLDASPIIVPHLKELEKDLTKIEYIFLTHFHGDHFLGLPFLLLDYGYLQAPQHPLVIVGPSGVKDKVQELTEISFPGLLAKLESKLEINYLEIIKPGNYTTDDRKLKFSAEQMSHGSSNAFGYKISINGKIVSYTGDTDLCQGVLNLAAGSDIIIIELSNPNQDVPGHMNIDKMKKLREKIGLDVKIVFNHVGPVTGEIDDIENALLPNDLDVIEI
jgi:ribonuclease BN (tRNA processing enzyme)